MQNVINTTKLANDQFGNTAAERPTIIANVHVLSSRLTRQ
jgi:hypothetical protein